MIAARLIVALVFLLPALRAASIEALLVAPDDANLKPMLDRLSQTTVDRRAAWTFWRGELQGRSVALTRTESDPLNAVAATTLAIRLYAPKRVIVFGPARAHDLTLRKGDVVVSERFVAFDGMISPQAALGAGSNALLWNRRPHPLMTAGERETPTPFFAADPETLAIAKNLLIPTGRTVTGALGSANQINREADRIAWLRAQWQTTTEDRESAHVAGVATLLGVPVIGIRIVEGEPGQAAEFVLRLMEALR